jgi:hypothetical protein
MRRRWSAEYKRAARAHTRVIYYTEKLSLNSPATPQRLASSKPLVSPDRSRRRVFTVAARRSRSVSAAPGRVSDRTTAAPRARRTTRWARRGEATARPPPACAGEESVGNARGSESGGPPSGRVRVRWERFASRSIRAGAGRSRVGAGVGKPRGPERSSPISAAPRDSRRRIVVLSWSSRFIGIIPSIQKEAHAFR